MFIIVRKFYNLVLTAFPFLYYTVPGKPPRNLSVDVTSPTSVLIGWETSPPLHESSIPTIALQIFYKLEANTTAVKRKEMNITRGYFVLDNLEKFAWYTIWVRSATSRGLGPESESFRIRTLEEGLSKTLLNLEPTYQIAKNIAFGYYV